MSILLTDKRIIDASLLILDKHLQKPERPLRALVDADFDRIRAARKKIAAGWYVQKLQLQGTYKVHRDELLNHWQAKHGWHICTRNLYASILSKLTVWERHGVSLHDKKRLDELEPGARLFLQFLQSQQPVLLL